MRVEILEESRRQADSKAQAQTKAPANSVQQLAPNSPRPPPENAKQPRWMRRREAAQYSGLSESLLEKLSASGHGPRTSRLSRAVLYRSDWIDEWLEAKAA